jgi:hypothetical protein
MGWWGSWDLNPGSPAPQTENLASLSGNAINWDSFAEWVARIIDQQLQGILSITVGNMLIAFSKRI